MTHTMDVIQQRERLRSQVEEFRTLIGANEGESTVDALHRYTAAVQLGCALKLEQRAKELSASSVGAVFAAIEGVPSEVIVAALIGGAALLRQGVETETQRPTRYPCSDTCTHDDAAKPGHPERVKERSEAVKALSEKILPGPDVVDGGPGTRGPVRTVSREARHAADSYAEGAEAMRAACLEAVREVLTREGMWTLNICRIVKAAIEGAAP